MSEKFSFEKLPNEPIGILKVYANYDMSVDAHNSSPAAYQFLDTQTEPIYFIVDFLELMLPDIEDISVGAMTAGLGQDPVFKHPNIKGLIIVTNSEMITLAAKGLDSDLYGNIKSQVFGTTEEALDYAREAV